MVKSQHRLASILSNVHIVKASLSSLHSLLLCVSHFPEPFLETSVILRSQEILWPGYYTVGLDVLDQQGKSCEVQKLQVQVCACTEAQVCRPGRRTSTGTGLGAGGFLALLLGILLLLCEYLRTTSVLQKVSTLQTLGERSTNEKKKTMQPKTFLANQTTFQERFHKQKNYILRTFGEPKHCLLRGRIQVCKLCVWFIQ